MGESQVGITRPVRVMVLRGAREVYGLLPAGVPPAGPQPQEPLSGD
jgi:hypothetical protein